MTKVRSLLAVLLVLVLGVGVTACGSDSDSDSNDSADTTQTSSDGGGTGDLDGTSWELMNIGIQQSVTSLPGDLAKPTLEFNGGEVSVFTGCNNGTGTAEVSDASIAFGPIAMTKKACDDVATQVETIVSQTLIDDVKYEQTAENLSLTKGQNTLIYIPAS
jgi:heat shock protein HslJ